MALGVLSAVGVPLALALQASAQAAGGTAEPVVQSRSGLVSTAQWVGPAADGEAIDFDVGLKIRDAAGAAALAQAVSDPSSPSYGRYLSPAEWEERFSPTTEDVQTVSDWLRSQGITVIGSTPDRMSIEAQAQALTVAHAFDTTLARYESNGRVIRLTSGSLHAPSAIAPSISGVTGVDELDLHPSPAGEGEAQHQGGLHRPVPAPVAVSDAPPCSSYFGEKRDMTDPPYGGGFPEDLPYVVCGYVPAQLQSAYGLAPSIGAGIDGRGVKVAVVDAYLSPTLFKDARGYSEENQPGQVLARGKFRAIQERPYDEFEACDAEGWYEEQTLDVEAVHALAPGAKIIFVGARDCSLESLFAAIQHVIDGHEADIVTLSESEPSAWVPSEVKEAFDDVLMMAAGTGVGVQFSSGDEGDGFDVTGRSESTYPPESPYATGVGGTTLEIGAEGQRISELGWSTAESFLCSETLASEDFLGCEGERLGTWIPAAPFPLYLYGGGGGTSTIYPEPYYQQGVVPAALAELYSSSTGTPNRVEPDISMDADPNTGMLVGETQTFPDGVFYNQYRVGGTSLSSPLFAGLMADADQAAHSSLGFVNPLLYSLASRPGSVFYDVLPLAHSEAEVGNEYVDGVDAEHGVRTSVRTFDYQGTEAHCTENGCTVQNISIAPAPGFDSMTGIGTPGEGFMAAMTALRRHR